MNDSNLIIAIATMISAFVLMAVQGPLGIPMLRRLKAGQSIREDGPQSHQAKSGTPTMGGIMIIIAIVITSLIIMFAVYKGVNADILVMLSATLLCCGIGFIDDFIKVVKKRNLGLRAWQKLLLQIITAVLIAVYEAKLSPYGTMIYIPIWKNYLDLGAFYIPFIVFVLVAMTNAVNLTDGLDGLAGGCSAIVAFFLAMTALMIKDQSVMIFSAAVAGACAGFLLYNRHPAKVFMGDTGSLALGAAIATAAVIMHIELILVIAGAVFVAEVCSVIIQVAVFKATHGKRRFFRMSPLHHHFELGGWKETKVVRVFWVVTLLLCVVSMFIL